MWRRIGRFGVPIAAALATVVIGAQGASAATATPTHPVPPPRCTGAPHLSTSTSSSGGVVVTKSVKPGKPGTRKCVVCIVKIKGHGGTGPVTKGGSGTVTTGGSGSGTVTTGSSGSGTVTIGSGKGGGVTIGKGGSVGVCPAPPGKPRPTD
jgi:hypothetical protein